MHEIPTKINKYNVYNEGDRLLGMGDELPLPGFESSSETVSGAGVLGEFDDPTVGYFSNQEMELPFRVLDRDAVDMLDQRKAVRLTVRGSAQSTNSEGDIVFHSVRVVVRGRMSKFELGKFKAGSGMEVKITPPLSRKPPGGRRAGGAGDHGRIGRDRRGQRAGGPGAGC